VIVYVAVKTAHSHWVQANMCGTPANFHCNIQLWNLEARR